MLVRLKRFSKNQESCIINGGKTSNYFKLERGARQGGPISAYFFILVLEMFFIFAKNDPKVKGLNIFKHEFLYAAYVSDTTFFHSSIKFYIILCMYTKCFLNLEK